MLPLDYLFQIQEDLTLGSYKTIETFMAQKFGICWNDNKENIEICEFLKNTMTLLIIDCGNYTRYQWMDK